MYCTPGVLLMTRPLIKPKLRKTRKQPYTEYSKIRAAMVFDDEFSADGRETRKHCGFGGGERPRHRASIIPRTWQMILLDHARNHPNLNVRCMSKSQLTGHAEELIGQFIARRRSYDAGSKIKLLAILVVEEAITPARVANKSDVCKTLGISEGRYDQKRKNGYSWQDDVDYVREFWLDKFLHGKAL